MTERRLPNNTYTVDVDEYSDAWHTLAKPIEEATGTKIHSFDPTISFCDHKQSSMSRNVVQLPVWFIERLNVALARQQMTEETTDKPKHLWRANDGKRLTINDDGTYSFDLSEMYEPHRYSYERLTGLGFLTYKPGGKG